MAEDIRSYELVPLSGETLPSFDPGAHISVEAPNGELRDYSLINPLEQQDRYVIAVKREVSGRGGSASIYDTVKTGDTLRISEPKNHFPLTEDAATHLLIAGGIGITPILSMVRHLEKVGQDYRLIYLSRSPQTTAFLEELSAPHLADKVILHFDEGDLDKALDLAPAIGAWVEGRHLYCCGPQGLMRAVRATASSWPTASVHFEDFGTVAKEAPAEGGGDAPFEIEIASNGDVITVGAGETIVEALARCGYDVPTSCESGTCGTCLTKLLGGEVEHRDYVLDEEDQKDFLMICVSRSKGGRLILDI
ncbi:MAG: PDR/VanB family oxidoreductase [Rhodovibrionaceae bacterium]